MHIKKRYINVILSLLILIIGIFAVYAVVDKTKAWHPADNILIDVGGNPMTLQEAISNNVFVEGTTTGYTSPAPTSSHSDDEIWVSIDGSEKTLMSAIAITDGLCGSSPTTSYSSALNPGHLANEIELSTGESFQDAIDNGDFCVYECVPDTCESLGYECGNNWPDGCGGRIDCGIYDEWYGYCYTFCLDKGCQTAEVYGTYAEGSFSECSECYSDTDMGPYSGKFLRDCATIQPGLIPLCSTQCRCS
ncbi:hypothetical protein KAR52_02330 [Candidatus Pacearchaeota archaeon]|nr:hypothetical protein [Candidatus Pacearchaeota archaeon]